MNMILITILTLKQQSTYAKVHNYNTTEFTSLTDWVMDWNGGITLKLVYLKQAKSAKTKEIRQKYPLGRSKTENLNQYESTCQQQATTAVKYTVYMIQGPAALFSFKGPWTNPRASVASTYLIGYNRILLTGN